MSVTAPAAKRSARRAFFSVSGLLGAAFLLSACGSLPLPDKPQRPMIYDFGPGVPPPVAAVSGPPLALAPVEASAPLEGNAVTYRLLYAGESQQPQPYALARWSMSPAQLVAQRLRETLAAQRPVVPAGEGLARLELRVALEEFSHVFDAPDASAGLIRLRATAVAPLMRVDRLLGQRTFSVRAPASSPDAAGGVQALTEATDEVGRQLSDWLAQLPGATDRVERVR